MNFLSSGFNFHLDYEAELASHPRFAGDATSATNVMMSFPLVEGGARSFLDKLAQKSVNNLMSFGYIA